MSEIIANVTGIKKDMSKNGKPFYRVALDTGDTLFAWDFNIIRGITKGDRAKLTIEKSKNGNFSYIAAAEPFAGEAMEDDAPFPGDEEETESESPAEVGKKYGFKTAYVPQGNTSNNPFITRMSALKTAVDYLNYCKPIEAGKWKPLSEEEVVSVAQFFETYVNTGSVEDEE